jgi:hypothetical protein
MTTSGATIPTPPATGATLTEGTTAPTDDGGSTVIETVLPTANATATIEPNATAAPNVTASLNVTPSIVESANLTPNATPPTATAPTSDERTYDYSVSIDRAWPVSGPGTATVAENGGSGTIPITINVPDTANGVAHVCVNVSFGGAFAKKCCFSLTALANASAFDPAGADFAIHALSPNPAQGELAVTFSLPRSGPARLELIDLNGRRVASREVGDLGAGRHVFRFDREILAIPAGVYAVKLIQNGHSVTRKVSVVR